MSLTVTRSSRIFVVAAVSMAVIIALFTGAALAQANPEICPDKGDWVWNGSSWQLTGPNDLGSNKYDTIGDPAQVQICAPDGYLISGYCVKGGLNTTTVNIDPAMECVTVTEPVEGKDVSHFSLNFVRDEEEEKGEWCSPGYWRNHLEEASIAAAACGPPRTLDNKYSDVFGAQPPRSPSGVRDNAPTDPTLLQVLQNPQWYGGAAFNNVGDLLSLCHPDVNFTGERVEDSCPLN
jgi:hypothetical protein